MPQRGDPGGHAAPGRVGQAQQIKCQYWFLLEDRFDFEIVGLLAEQSKQAQQREFRGLQAAALDHGGVGKVIPLKKVKAKRVAQLHLLVAFHFLGEDRFTQWLEIIYQLFEPIRGDAADIDLDNFSELEQRARLVERFWPLPDRQDVTCATQLFTASQHFRRRAYGFQNFQDY